jgi:hypothetical protein
MENDNSTLHEPLLEKDVEENLKDDCCSTSDNHGRGPGGGAGEQAAAARHNHDDGEESDGAAVTTTTHNNTNEAVSDDDPSSSSSIMFTVAAELAEMANLAWPLAVSFFCRMGMASTDSAFVGHIHDQHRYVMLIYVLCFTTTVVIFCGGSILRSLIECYVRVVPQNISCFDPHGFLYLSFFFWLTPPFFLWQCLFTLYY